LLNEEQIEVDRVVHPSIQQVLLESSAQLGSYRVERIYLKRTSEAIGQPNGKFLVLGELGVHFTPRLDEARALGLPPVRREIPIQILLEQSSGVQEIVHCSSDSLPDDLIGALPSETIAVKLSTLSNYLPANYFFWNPASYTLPSGASETIRQPTYATGENKTSTLPNGVLLRSNGGQLNCRFANFGAGGKFVFDTACSRFCRQSCDLSVIACLESNSSGACTMRGIVCAKDNTEAGPERPHRAFSGGTSVECGASVGVQGAQEYALCQCVR
jgi:hypothetical protein